MARFSGKKPDRRDAIRKNPGRNDSGDRFSRRPSSGGERPFRSRDSDEGDFRKFSGRGRPNRGSDKQMHNVKCDSCGRRCEVPFRPTEGKPVYCSDCFRKNDSPKSGNSGQFEKEFDKINKKLDTIMRVLNCD